MFVRNAQFILLKLMYHTLTSEVQCVMLKVYTLRIISVLYIYKCVRERLFKLQLIVLYHVKMTKLRNVFALSEGYKANTVTKVNVKLKRET